MTLEQLAQSMKDAISDKGTLSLTEAMAATPAFNTVLELMALDSDTLDWSSITPEGIAVEDDVLTATGTGSLYGSGGPLRLSLSGQDPAKRTCDIENTLQEFAIGDLKTYGLVKDPDFNPQQLPPQTYHQLVLKADSDTQILTLAAAEEPTDFSILPLLNITMTEAGFALRRIIGTFGDMQVELTLSGIFMLDESVALGIEITVPVTARQSPQWLITFRGNTGQKPVSIGNLIQVAAGTNLFALMPPGLSAIGDFCLNSLTLFFIPSAPSVSLIMITIGTTQPKWDLISGFSIIRPELSFSITNPFTDADVQVDVSGTFVLAETILLGVSMSASLKTGTWTIELTTDNDKLKLGDLSGAPGGINFADLNLPDGINTGMPIVLERFSIVFNTRFRSFNSMAIQLYSTKSWDVLGDGNFTVGEPRFDFSITDPLNQFNQRDFSLLIKGNITVVKLLSMDFAIRHPNNEQGWIMSADTTQPLPLPEFFDKLYGSPIDWPESIRKLTLEKFSFTYYVKTKTYEFICSLAKVWSIELGGETFGVEGVAVTFKSANGVKSGGIEGRFDIFGLQLTAGYKFSPTTTDVYFIFNDTVEVHYIGNELTFQLRNTSLGDMIAFMVGLVTGDSDFSLPAPWDLLNKVSLNGFMMKINLDDKTVSFKYALPSPVDLGFMSLNSVSLEKTPNSKVNIIIDCVFLGQKQNLGWDVLNDNPPSVPGMGEQYFDLQFAAMGQRVKLNDAAKIKSVTEAITAMQAAFPDPAAGTNPLNNAPKLSFNQASSWLIGTHFIVLSAIDIAAIFNDPELYGLSIGVGGERFQMLKGLQFEILYKKITETIGVYEIELKLPDAMRQLEMGQVSITLPIIGISIYTNGGFKLDLGFPYNGDFSRSFTIQVFPFIGSGGFYFGYLGDAPSKRLPGKYNKDAGTFNPVIEFGLGLSVGVGKTISMGVLSAGISITVQGIVEGTLAFFNANTSKYPQLKDEMYFWLQGSVGVAGHLFGKIDFVVVTATVDLRVYALIRLIYASYQPIYIYLEAGVTVKVSIRIDLWLFSVTLSFSFSATVRQSFTIPGAGGTAPWNTGLQAARPYRALSLYGTNRQDTSSISWKTFDLTARDPLEIYFLPQFSAGAGTDGKATSFYIASLFLRTSALKVEPITIPEDFDKLVQMLWIFAAAAALPDGGAITDTKTVLDQTITADDLDKLFAFLAPVDATDAPLPYATILGMLSGCFDAVLRAPDTENGGQEYEVALFPMIPDTTLDVLRNEEKIYGVNFKEQTLCTAAYHKTILDHFEELAVQYENSTEPKKKTLKAYDDAKLSLSTFVFQDYFVLVLRQVVQSAIDRMKAYNYAWKDDSNFATICQQFYTGDDQRYTDIAEANRDVDLKTGAVLRIAGIEYPVSAANNFAAIAAQYEQDAQKQDAFLQQLAAINSKTPQLILQEVTIETGTGQYLTGINETLESLAIATGVDAGTLVVLNKNLPLLVKLSPVKIPELSHTAGDAENLGTVAQQFNVTPGLVLASSAQQTGLYPKDTLITLPQLAALKVGEVLDALIAAHTFQHLSGLASKFMLGGLRLPPPADTGDSKPVSLYTLTGQQYALPLLDEKTDEVKVTLTAAAPLTLGTASYTLQPEDIKLVNELRALNPKAHITQEKKQSFSKTEPRKFNLSGKINWQSTEAVHFVNDNSQQPFTQAALWSLSPTLQTMLQEDKETPPQLGLYIGHQPNPGLPMINDAATIYSWATLLKVQVREVLTSSGAPLPCVYELVGLDEDGLALAEKIIAQYSETKKNRVSQWHVLFAPAASAEEPSGLVSQGIDTLSAFIVQSNLSTLSHPTASTQLLTVTGSAGNLLNTDAMNSLQLLWQCSIVKTGGYYLYYRVNATGEGLPDTCFDSSHNAYLHFALALNITDGLLPGFVNAAGVGDRVNDGDILYAASEQQFITVTGKTTPQDLIKRYRTGWSRLAASLSEQPLRAHVEIRVRGAVHQASEKNNTLRSLAGQLGHDEAELIALNPHLDGKALTPGTPFLRPPFVYKPSAPQSLAQAARHTGGSATRLLFDNRRQALFDDEAELTVDDQWLYTYATIPAGNTIFFIARDNPDQQMMKATRTTAEPDPQKTLSMLYNLLSFQVLPKAPFSQSVVSVPVGPADNDTAEATRQNSRPLLFDADPSWHYEQILPVYRFWSDKGLTAGDVPPPASNPYLGVGSLFQLGFEWRDIYGNVPVEGAAPIDDLGIPIGYYDDLLALSQWPATTASFLITKPASLPQLAITLNFDPNKYIPRKKANCEDDPAQNTEGFRSLAVGDLMKATTAYYQLVCTDVKATLTCNIGSGAQSFDKNLLVDYIAGVYAYLKTVSAETYNYTYVSADGVKTLGQIAQEYGVILAALQTVNPGTPAVPSAGTCLVIPVTALPPAGTIIREIAWTSTAAYFALETSITLGREENLVDEQFLDVPSVYTATAFINPATSAAQGNDKLKPYSYFAQSFEAAFPGARIAAGKSGNEKGEALWVVQFNGNGYTYSIDDAKPFFYAPMPLFNQLVTGLDFTVYPYVSGKGLELNKPITQTFSGVDLDVWASVFLSACDQVFSSTYIVPAKVLDACLQSSISNTLLDAKRSIAAGIVKLIADVQKKSTDTGCTNPYTPPTPEMLTLAKDALEQQLLVQLGAAYQVDAVVQFPVAVKAPASAAAVPNLFGAPIVTGSKVTDDKELSLSTSRIALADGTSYLTFLFSTKRQEQHSNYPLTLEFQANAFEYDIHAVESLNPGYYASSWLSFVEATPPVAIGATQIPVPLRAYPAPPSLKEQQLMQMPGSGTNIFLQQRQWQYGYAYERVSARQDLISTSLRFNVLDANKSNLKSAENPDLFELLAMFNHVWTPLASDLNTLVAGITPASSADEMTAAKNTLDAFSWLMTKAGTAWNNWLAEREKYRDPIASHENYEYMIRENLDAAGADHYEMTVQITGLKKDVLFVEPYFEGYTSKQKSKTGDTATYDLTKTDGPGIYLTVDEAKKIVNRMLVYPGLDILNTQNAWGGVFITRNKYLFTDEEGKDDTCRPTNDNFVYQTPTVRYSSILTPLLTYDQPIDLASFAAGNKLPLLDYLQLLFTNLFENILDETLTSTTRSIQLNCTYYYSLTGDSEDELMVNLPVLLVPPYDFQLPKDWSKDCTTTPKSFICQLNDAIWTNWFEKLQPAKEKGRFAFDISVYSNLATTQLPVLRFSDIRLALDDIGQG